MNEPKGSKKKLTLIATEEGVERAKKALMRFGFESQTNFAQTILISRTTVSKFFNHKPIQVDSFKRICEQLGSLKWQEIAGISENKQTKNPKILTNKKEIPDSPDPDTEITIIARQTKIKKAVITLKGDINSLNKIKILQSILREYSGDTIEIKDIQPGSIKISLEGSPEDINKLIIAIKSKELTQLDGFFIEDVVEVDDKWKLVQKIRARKVEKLDFRKVDLSNADLGGADLSGADLSGADLSGADLMSARLVQANLTYSQLNDVNLIRANLIGANLSNAQLLKADLTDADLTGARVENARFGYNSGISESLKRDLITRGAIFEGEPISLSSIEKKQKEPDMSLLKYLADKFTKISSIDRQIAVKEWADANRARNAHDMGPKNYQRCLYDLKLGGKYHELEWDEDGHLKYQ